MHTNRTIAPLAAFLVAGLAVSAAAQNLLDAGQRNRPDRPEPRASPVKPTTVTTRGRALDANQQVGSSGLNSNIANFQQELALRNAVVTGNVGGGKAFRGDVGYSAADDFRGETGSDDLFSFQRDSAYSGLATQNVRGITPLQFQLTESTAGQTEGMLGNLIVRRSAAAVTASEATGKGANLSVDPYGNLRGSLRSTSDFVLRNARFPFILGTLGKEDEGASRMYMAANPLIGVKAITLGNAAFSVQERPDLIREGKIAGVGKKELEDAQRDGLSAPVGKRFEVPTPFDALRSDLARKADNFISKRYGEETKDEKAGEIEEKGTPATTGSMNERFESLMDEVRDSLRKRMKAIEDAKPSESPDSQSSDEKNEDSNTDDLKNPGAKKVENKTLTTQEVVDRARALLDNGEVRIQKLLDDEGVDDLYSWHMKKGETSLKGDRWFEAEERFTAALRSKPGDAIAAAGRINSQIGGGLFLSAGVNIRNLFAAYPELIPARYSVELFPSGKRLDSVRLTLRDRIQRVNPFTRDAALILAYIGWQAASHDDLVDAFEALDRVHKEAGDEPDALEAVLRAIWLKEKK